MHLAKNQIDGVEAWSRWQGWREGLTWTMTTAWERVERLKAATERASGGGRGLASPASMPTSSAFSSTSANGFGEGAG